MAPEDGPRLGRPLLDATALGAAVVVAASWFAASRGVAGWEVDAGRWAYDLPDASTDVLEVVMQAGTRGAAPGAAVVLALCGWRWRAAGVAVAGLLAWLLARIGKAIMERPRPSSEELDRAVREVVDGVGYPSGHAAVATGLAAAIILLGRPRWWATSGLVAVAALTALARVHLGVHWPLDVVGGAGLGALAAVAVAALVGIPPSGPVPRAGAEDELVVATFNIRNGRAWDGWNSWPLRSGAAAAMARQLGADVLGVQEAYAFQARFLSSALPGYVRVGRGRGRRGGEWCAIYVREDRLRVVDAITRWYGDDPERPGSRLPEARFPRVATEVRLVEVAADGAGTGDELVVVNTHLDAGRRPTNRLLSIQQLVTWLDPARPTVVLGDLNATPKEHPELFAALTGAGLADAVPPDAGGTAHDFRGGTDHRRIDHILVSRHWEVRSAGVVADPPTKRLPSDHWPVVAVLHRRREGGPRQSVVLGGGRSTRPRGPARR